MATSAGKRVKISKMQQHILLSVLVASLVVGVALVFSIFLIKWISFNSKILEAKGKAVSQYDAAIKNVGICRDENKDGSFTDRELDNCDPDALDVATLNGTLRYNVMIGLANNTALESVARPMLERDCYAADGSKINFTEMYRKATTDKERADYLKQLTKCSALRVIPDALPSSRNEEALLASLNEIFNIAGFEPEGLSPAGGSQTSPIKGLSVIPVSLQVETNTALTHRVLSDIERSIREFDITTANIKWGGVDRDGQAKLELQAQANAYYVAPSDLSESKIVVYASDEAKKKK